MLEGFPPLFQPIVLMLDEAIIKIELAGSDPLYLLLCQIFQSRFQFPVKAMELILRRVEVVFHFNELFLNLSLATLPLSKNGV